MTKKQLYKINSYAAYFYHNQLPQNRLAQQYLYNVRRLNKETVESFILGVAPNQWDPLLKYMKTKGFNEQQLLEANLVRVSSKGTYYDYFRNRIIFPIKDIYGNIIGFGGRKMNDEEQGPKYLNSSESKVFKKRLNLYGLDLAKNHLNNEPLILCEGYMDCIAMQKSGFKTAVAGLGTALTAEQVLLISSLTDKVVLAYDGDEAGLIATKKAIGLFGEYAASISLSIIKMKDAKDADEFINKFGADKFKKEILDKSISIFDFEMDYINEFEENKFDKGVSTVIAELIKS